jgi:hypothetical protein
LKNKGLVRKLKGFVEMKMFSEEEIKVLPRWRF